MEPLPARRVEIPALQFVIVKLELELPETGDQVTNFLSQFISRKGSTALRPRGGCLDNKQRQAHNQPPSYQHAFHCLLHFTFHLVSLSYRSAYGKSVSIASLVSLTARAIKELGIATTEPRATRRNSRPG
jgi:hypothetical protein